MKKELEIIIEKFEKIKDRNLIEWLESDIKACKDIVDKIPSLSKNINEKKFLLKKAEELSESEYDRGFLFGFLCCYKYLYENFDRTVADEFEEEYELNSNKEFIEMKKDLIINVQENNDCYVENSKCSNYRTACEKCRTEFNEYLKNK